MYAHFDDTATWRERHIVGLFIASVAVLGATAIAALYVQLAAWLTAGLVRG